MCTQTTSHWGSPSMRLDYIRVIRVVKVVAKNAERRH